MLRELIVCYNEGDCTPALDMGTEIVLQADAWSEMKHEIIINCWKKAGFDSSAVLSAEQLQFKLMKKRW